MKKCCDVCDFGKFSFMTYNQHKIMTRFNRHLIQKLFLIYFSGVIKRDIKMATKFQGSNW